jgi:hypothetical protein
MLSRVALSFALCLNSCNTLLPNLDGFGSALYLLMILVRVKFEFVANLTCGSRAL